MFNGPKEGAILGVNEKVLSPNAAFIFPKEEAIGRGNKDWPVIGPNNGGGTMFVGTEPNLDEIDEQGAPKGDRELFARNTGADDVPNIGWEDVVPEEFVENEKLELKTEGDDANIDELDAPKGGLELLVPNPEADAVPNTQGVDNDLVPQWHADV